LSFCVPYTLNSAENFEKKYLLFPIKVTMPIFDSFLIPPPPPSIPAKQTALALPAKMFKFFC
jgi:hypothetical protein